jgi:hypothetical protein
MTDRPYEKWLAERRKVDMPAALADQIMRQVAELECQRRDIWWLRVVQRVEQSRAARWAVCGGALAIGSLPFVFFAHVARLLSF